MDCCKFAKLAMKSRAALAAETLFHRKQLALYQERKAKRRPTSVVVAGRSRLWAAGLSGGMHWSSSNLKHSWDGIGEPSESSGDGSRVHLVVRRGVSNQRWRTFIQNHAKAIFACDFFVFRDSDFPDLIRLGSDGGRVSANSPCQCHATSND